MHIYSEAMSSHPYPRQRQLGQHAVLSPTLDDKKTGGVTCDVGETDTLKRCLESPERPGW
jgi:hypothetical protein